MGPRGRRVRDRAVPADHGAARAGGAAADDWSVPDPTSFYVRASIVEQLPDPLTPLFAELVDGSVTRSLQALMGELLRSDDVIRDGDVGLPTVNGYAYYRYSRRGMAADDAGVGSGVPRLLRGGGVGLRDRWRERAHPQYVRAVERAAAAAGGGDDEHRAARRRGGAARRGHGLLHRGPDDHPAGGDQRVARSPGSTRGSSAAPGDPPAVTFLLGFDSAPIRAEKSLYDLAAWTRTHAGAGRRAARARRRTTTVAAIDADEPPAGVDAGTWQEWCDRFEQHLARHGHTVYNLDFVNPVPADDPAPLLETLRFYLDGGGRDPGSGSGARRSAATRPRRSVAARLDPVRRAAFRRLLHWAQAIAPLREDALADVGLAWPQLRRMLRELGGRLVGGGRDRPAGRRVLAAPRRDPRGDRTRCPRRGDVVAQRKALWRGQRRVDAATAAAEGRLGGQGVRQLDARGVGRADRRRDEGHRGERRTVTATARVLGGPHDFGRMQPGDVLVASITTPAWTSLFAMAAAVVTDIGGPLSHSSIVAREYGIPAVLGTNVATRRIPDGARVRVDGDAGTVTLLDEPGDPTIEAASTAR